MTDANSRLRLTVVGFVVFALFGALFARLWFLQVGNSTSYAARDRAEPHPHHHVSRRSAVRSSTATAR